MWVRWFIRGLINPFDKFAIFSKGMVFFKVATTSTDLRFIQPHFIKRRWMINNRDVGDEPIIIEINIASRVKKAIANIIMQGIIASAEHSFKQVINDQMILC